jgi:nitrogen regulatory protein PII 2
VKEVFAIIQPSRVQATKEALAAADVFALHVFPVLGHGRGQIDPQILTAAAEGNEEAVALLGRYPRLMPRRAVCVMVPDAQVEVAVQAIVQANQTGEAGDGKIYVLPLKEVARVRTAECGEAAL